LDVILYETSGVRRIDAGDKTRVPDSRQTGVAERLLEGQQLGNRRRLTEEYAEIDVRGKDQFLVIGNVLVRFEIQDDFRHLGVDQRNLVKLPLISDPPHAHRRIDLRGAIAALIKPVGLVKDRQNVRFRYRIEHAHQH
jgi:hypothetical protein